MTDDRVKLLEAQQANRALHAKVEELKRERRDLLRQLGVEDDGPGMVGQEGE